MKGKSVESCRSWVDDIYWAHFKFLHFAQFLRTGFHQHLALPKTFSENLKEKLPENVSLRGPSGVVWGVALTTKDDTWYFTNGWQQFLKDHSLKENDFLVFKYNGESMFDVLIFDGESFCERAASYFVQKCGHTEHEGGRLIKHGHTDNSVEEVNTLFNAGVQDTSPEKSVDDIVNMIVATAVPSETPSERAFNAGVDSASHEQFIGVNGIAAPAAVPSQTTGKRTRRQPSTANRGQNKQKRRPRNLSSTDQGTVNWVTGNIFNSVEEVNTLFNDGVQDASSEKYVDDNNIIMAAAVPSETPTERAFNAGVDSASHEQFIDVDGIAEPADVPSQTTAKRIRRQPNTASRGQNKQRRRPRNISSAHQGVVNWVTDSEPASVGRSGRYEIYTSNRSPVTENEIQNALQLAQAACTSDGLYIVMRPTHVYKRFYVSIPNKWILEHLSTQSQNVILRVGETEWLAKYSLHNIRHTGGLTGGWKHFALDNNLEEFDVCVFKPGSQINNTLIMDVTIFRVVEDITPLSSVKSPGKMGRKK